MIAPVPFLVGLNSSCLVKLPVDTIQSGIVFVNLDNDNVNLGWKCYEVGNRFTLCPYLPEPHNVLGLLS